MLIFNEFGAVFRSFLFFPKTKLWGCVGTNAFLWVHFYINLFCLLFSLASTLSIAGIHSVECFASDIAVFVNKSKGKKQTKGGIMDFQSENRKLTTVRPLLFCVWIRINRCMAAQIEPVLWFPFQPFFGFVMDYGMSANNITRIRVSVCVRICTLHFSFTHFSIDLFIVQMRTMYDSPVSWYALLPFASIRG